MQFRILISSLFFCLSCSAQIQSVEKVTITVSDADKVKAFYIDALRAKEVSSTTISGKDLARLYNISDPSCIMKSCLLKIGNELVELQSFKGKTIKPAPIPEDSKSNDLWFQHIAVVVPNMQKGFDAIHQKMAVYVSTAPQTLPAYLPAAAGISAFYFRDPDGHNIEIINFPAGKGNPKWQADTSATFTGIDHTAIGVSNTDAQYKFYKDILGMNIGGHSENYGTEQEHLNQVFGARLWITGMQAPKGFGIEFLQYLAPPGGRKYPANSHVYDLWHWHTTIKTDHIEDVYKKCIAGKFSVISKGLVTINNTSGLTYTKAFMVRDADGHAVLITN
jgi:catechol 2,3-dioxygenase-like lactoylglutathione lyase family enzyme